MVPRNRLLSILALLALLALAAPVAPRIQAQEHQTAEPAAGAADVSGEAGHSESHADEGHGADEQAAGGHGDFGIKGDLPFWSGVAFVIFALVVWKMDVLNGIAAKMFSSVAAHETREKTALANAESLTREANEILRKNRGRVEALDETVKSTLAEASRDAAHTTNELLKSAQSEASLISGRASLEIERVRDQTLNDIFDALATRVTHATEQRLRSQLQSGDQDRLIDETLAQIAN